MIGTNQSILSSKTLETTLKETGQAMAAIRHGLEGTHSNLFLQLLPAAVLFFKARDLLAFEQIYQSSVYSSLELGSKLRHLPTLEQLLAVLESQRKGNANWAQLTPQDLAIVEGLQQWTDTSLEVVIARRFRDHLLLSGVPLEESELSTAPFSTPRFDYALVGQVLLRGWDLFRQRGAQFFS